jgi:hypothetical protein
VDGQAAALRLLPYSELVARVDESHHERVDVDAETQLMGEVQVFWETGSPGAIRVVVDACEPAPGEVESIASDQFIVRADGSVVDC